MAKDVKQEEQMDVEDGSSDQDLEHQGSDGADTEADDGAGDDQGDGKKSKYVPYDRFKEINDRSKRREAELRDELEAQRRELDLLRGRVTPTKADEDKPIDPSAYENKPIEFVEDVAERRIKKALGDKLSEVDSLKEEVGNLRLRAHVAEARAMFPDFEEFQDDIADMIHEQNRRGDKSIDPRTLSGIEALYHMAKGRRNGERVSAAIKKEPPKVPHNESASRRNGKAKAKDPREMSRDELRSFIGVAEKDGYYSH